MKKKTYTAYLVRREVQRGQRWGQQSGQRGIKSVEAEHGGCVHVHRCGRGAWKCSSREDTLETEGCGGGGSSSSSGCSRGRDPLHCPACHLGGGEARGHRQLVTATQIHPSTVATTAAAAARASCEILPRLSQHGWSLKIYSKVP